MRMFYLLLSLHYVYSNDIYNNKGDCNIHIGGKFSQKQSLQETYHIKTKNNIKIFDMELKGNKTEFKKKDILSDIDKNTFDNMNKDYSTNHLENNHDIMRHKNKDIDDSNIDSHKSNTKIKHSHSGKTRSIRTDTYKLDELNEEDKSGNKNKIKFDDKSVSIELLSPMNKINVTSDQKKYLYTIVQNGVIHIRLEYKYIQQQLSKNKNIDKVTSLIQNNTVTTFRNTMERYIGFAFQQKFTYGIDEQYQFLDIVAFLNILLIDQEMKMVDEIAAEIDIPDFDRETVLDTIIKNNTEHFQYEIGLLCLSLDICRPYPGFFEYIADLINEVLKLNDDKLSILVKISRKYLIKKQQIFMLFISHKTTEVLKSKLSSIAADVSKVRNFLIVLRSTINLRYTLINVIDDGLKLKTKSVRILLDIIDNIFYNEFDDLTIVTFNTTSKAIGEWRKAILTDVDIPVNIFIDHIVNMLKNCINNDFISQVMTLIDLIVRRTTENKNVQRKLFTDGPNFIKN